MRSHAIRLISALAAAAVVAAVARVAPLEAQGMIIVRPPACVTPPPCARGGACMVRPCGEWPVTPVVVRSSSRVHVELADHVLRYEVTETFVNRGMRLGEADYVFPLPNGAAFQDLKLSINGELVSGEVLDATQARGVYEEIVRRQRDPALVEWMGSGLLRARIFPIAAGEEKTVVVRFQTVARREGDALRIDYTRPGLGCPSDAGVYQPAVGGNCAPMGAGVVARSVGGDESGLSDSTGEPRFTFALTYRPSEGYGTPYSPTHSLVVGHDGDRRTVRVDGDARDITILLPMPRSTAAAVTMLPYAPGDGPGFALIAVAPPVLHVRPTPRDVTFVLDVSGSMSGRKIEQARAAGRDLLATLTPADRFRMIDFSTDVRTFRDGYEHATPEHIREAQHYLDELDAEGATNIEGALRRALEAPAGDDAGGGATGGDTTGGDTTGGDTTRAARMPIVLFITDGEPTVGQQSPDALVTEAERHLGHVRLFAFGLGADVNASLLEQLALHGRGTAQFVRPDESVERAVSLVAHRLTDPVITDVALRSDNVRLTSMLPESMGDLFAGQDLIILTRYQGSGRTHSQFTGRTAAGPVSWASDVSFPERERENSFVARLWATQRIGYLEAARHQSGPSPEVDAELTSLGERFGIPTELTSYLVREPALTDARTLGGPDMSPTIESRLQAKALPLRKDGPHVEAQVVTGVATMSSENAANAAVAGQPGGQAFARAKVAAAQRAVTTLAAADSTGAFVGGSGGRAGVRHGGDRTFVLHDSTWTDTRFHEGIRVVRVQAFSPAYFSLLQAVPDLRLAFAVGDRVVVAGRQVAVEVTSAGVSQLSDADVAAVQAGW